MGSGKGKGMMGMKKERGEMCWEVRVKKVSFNNGMNEMNRVG